MSCLVYEGEKRFCLKSSVNFFSIFLNTPEDDLELRQVQLVTVGVCLLVFGLRIPIH